MKTDSENMTALLLEDHPLIAMDTETLLTRAGFARIVHFASVASALAWLATSEPDLAVIEITLQNEPGTALAQQLFRRKVPVLVYTAANRALITDPTVGDAEWVSKPAELEILVPAIRRAMERTG